MTADDAIGGGAHGAATPVPRPWADRLDDPDEPLYTVAVTGDLLGLDSQALRRLDDALPKVSARPSGNQRRYSRRDIETLAAAVRLSGEGIPAAAIARILVLQQQVDSLTPDPAP